MSEKATTLALSAVAQNLRTISFVRPESALSPIDSSIEYNMNVIPAHTLHIGDGVVPVVRHVRVEISATVVRDAKYAQFDALPRLEAPARWGIREWQTATLSYAKENQIAAILAASAGGVLLREAGRVLYSHAQGVIGV